jgi:tetratricopeptide (TPR) repeat protein
MNTSSASENNAPPDDKGKERRKYIRFPYNYPIRIRRLGEAQYQDAESDNISLGGVMLFSKVVHGVGESVEMEIDFPLQTKRQVLSVTGVVCWIRKKEMPPYSYSLGVSFQNFTQNQSQNLQNMIQTFLECKQKTNPPSQQNDKEQARLLFLKGLEYFRNDQLEEALEIFSKVIETIPEHAAAYSYRAYTYERKGESKKAEEDYNKAKELGGF